MSMPAELFAAQRTRTKHQHKTNMAPAHNQTKIIGYALKFLADNFASATKGSPVAFRKEDVEELAAGFPGGTPKNTAVNYIYRDGSNYKNRGRIVLTGTPKDLGKFVVKLRKYLDDKTWFAAAQIGVPSVFFDTKGPDDHGWHEIAYIEDTGDAPTDTRTPARFLKDVISASNSGWKPDNNAPAKVARRG